MIDRVTIDDLAAAADWCSTYEAVDNEDKTAESILKVGKWLERLATSRAKKMARRIYAKRGKEYLKKIQDVTL